MREQSRQKQSNFQLVFGGNPLRVNFKPDLGAGLLDIYISDKWCLKWRRGQEVVAGRLEVSIWSNAVSFLIYSSLNTAATRDFTTNTPSIILQQIGLRAMLLHILCTFLTY